jgi:hypothetical protein
MRKKRTKRVSKKKNYQKATILISLLLLLVAFATTIIWIKNPTIFSTRGQALPGKIIVLYPNPETNHPNLQLRTFPYIMIPAGPSIPVPSGIPVPSIPTQISSPSTSTPNTSSSVQMPSIGGYCGLDSVKPSGNTCQCMDTNAVACPSDNPAIGTPSCSNGSIAMRLPPGLGPWYCVQIGSPGMTDPNPPAPPSGCSAACIAKPVIYLYPEHAMPVDVSVKVPGTIAVSDPLYPQNGWKNVLARPDGSLTYQGKQYSELFYESSVTPKIQMPKTGIVIRSDELSEKLTTATTRLGLNEKEQKEFLEYWVPALTNLHTAYIFFSIFPPDVKESLDHVTVSPAPDTRIEFIAYFKGLTKPIAVDPLVFPATPPARNGFTEVEWGGTIDRF